MGCAALRDPGQPLRAVVYNVLDAPRLPRRALAVEVYPLDPPLV